MQVFLLPKCITFGEDEKWAWKFRDCSDKGYSYKMRNKTEKKLNWKRFVLKKGLLSMPQKFMYVKNELKLLEKLWVLFTSAGRNDHLRLKSGPSLWYNLISYYRHFCFDVCCICYCLLIKFNSFGVFTI